MPNLAQQLRDRVLAEHPQAQVVERGPTFLNYQVGENNFVYMGSSEHIHYEDGDGTIHEIDTDWADDTGEQGAISVPYRHMFDKSGKRIFTPRLAFPNETITFSTPKVKGTNNRWSNLNMPGKLRKGNVMEFSGNGFRLVIANDGSGVKVDFIALDPAVVRPIRWDVTLTGLTRTDRSFVSQSDGAVVAEYPEFTMMDAEGEERLVAENITDIAIELHPDTTGLVFPVTIDPAVSLQLINGADDGYIREIGTGTAAASATTTAAYAGRYATSTASYRYSTWQRWSSLPSDFTSSSPTINAATMEIYNYTAATTNEGLRINLENAKDPQPVASITDYNARSVTGYVSWSPGQATTGWKVSTDFKNLLQTVITNYGPLSSIMVRLYPASTTYLALAADNRRLVYYSANYTTNGTLRPILKINYTVPNTAPTVSSAPVFSYANGHNALGPNSSPLTVTFTITDAEQSSGSWYLDSSSTLSSPWYASGTWTKDVPVTTTIAWDNAVFSEGNQTIHLHYHDGALYGTTQSFTIKRDTIAPAAGTITVTPTPVTGE